MLKVRSRFQMGCKQQNLQGKKMGKFEAGNATGRARAAAAKLKCETHIIIDSLPSPELPAFFNDIQESKSSASYQNYFKGGGKSTYSASASSSACAKADTS